MSNASVLWLNITVILSCVNLSQLEFRFLNSPLCVDISWDWYKRRLWDWEDRCETELWCSEAGLGPQAPLQLEHGELTATNITGLTAATAGDRSPAQWMPVGEMGKCG